MNIVLTGFMGTGKSTVGKILAKKLKMAYVNADGIIEEKEKKKISQIFEEDGEDYFRKKEREVIKDISKDNHQVIDLGGGAIIKEENLKDLRKNGLIICLTASLEEIMKRTEGEERPLLNSKFQIPNPKKEKKKKIEELLKKRESYYRKADILLDTTGISPLQVAEKIIKKLKIKS